MRASGRTIRCTATARLNGLMEGSTKDSTLMIRSMELVLSTGPMDESMWVHGKTASSTGGESTT